MTLRWFWRELERQPAAQCRINVRETHEEIWKRYTTINVYIDIYIFLKMRFRTHAFVYLFTKRMAKYVFFFFSFFLILNSSSVISFQNGGRLCFDLCQDIWNTFPLWVSYYAALDFQIRRALAIYNSHSLKISWGWLAKI